MNCSINRINLSVSAIETVEVGVEDKISSGYRKPIKIFGRVIGEGFLGDYKFGDICDLL